MNTIDLLPCTTSKRKNAMWDSIRYREVGGRFIVLKIYTLEKQIYYRQFLKNTFYIRYNGKNMGTAMLNRVRLMTTKKTKKEHFRYFFDDMNKEEYEEILIRKYGRADLMFVELEFFWETITGTPEKRPDDYKVKKKGWRKGKIRDKKPSE